NVQNDVIAMIDSKGNEVVRYTYDSWGRVMSITGSMKDSLGERNPFRYRGYYYDTETGLYYLKNRYYDPEIRRFISTDSIDVLEVQNDLYDKNLYAYCDNNPVMRHDLTGNIWGFVLSLGIGALSGALAVTKIEVVGQVVGNAAISMGSYAISEGENATVQGLIGSGVIGAAGGFVGGSGLNLDRQMGVKAYSDMRVQRCVSPRKVAMYASKSTAATSNIRVAAGRFAASVGVSSAMSNVKSFLGNAISSCFNWLKRRFK
ncbi:MAG: RHS repeat-associated core domain-containing protein, partial [Blautia sp.]|nr:RHS repeat-associated core domain-containing protein [Blautia sp.]